MDEIPLKVTVAIPTNSGPRYGRYATTRPYGETTSFRVAAGFMQEVDRARALIDPMLTRNLFMHLAVLRVAKAINKHNDDYLEWVREATNAGHDNGPEHTVQPADEGTVGRTTDDSD